MRSISGWRWLVVTVLVALLAAGVAGTVAAMRARAVLADGVANDARLRAALIDSEVARFQLMPLALADDRDVVAALSGKAGARDVLNRKLEALARMAGAAVIYVVDSRGIAIAASNWRSERSFVGGDYGFRRYVRDARRTGAGAQFARGTISRRAGLFLSRRTVDRGAVVVKLEFDRIEAAWARAGGDTFVRDADGLVLVANRPEWRFATTRPLSAARLAAVRADASLPPGALRPLPAARGSVAATVPTAQPGWTLTLRRPAAPVIWPAARAAGLGAALLVAALAALAWGARQRRALTQRRTSELEAAVAARTAELTREMEERAAGEARAAELREGLRQANRLATLGQVTASVAHETAQPVAAIRTYAQTSATLLRNGDTAAVRDNLGTIARLADRIGTVTAELRDFSRRRTGELRPVPLAAVIDGALLILKEQLRAVALVRPVIPATLMVVGGRVRLEQVMVNILQNAVEALRDTAAPRIVIELTQEDGRVTIAVTDNGPGVSPEIAARLFTPFATGRAEGLGLGLVIAQDIMAEMGGSLRHVAANDGPRDDGGAAGARFEIAMVAA